MTTDADAERERITRDLQPDPRPQRPQLWEHDPEALSYAGLLTANSAFRLENERLRDENGELREALEEYAEHTSWRCTYRSRYGKCVCGLDDTMAKLGLPPVPVNDPEALAAGRQEASDCVVGTFSSRICERGTKGCDVRHAVADRRAGRQEAK